MNVAMGSKEQNIDMLVRIVKAFNGDIYGGVVRDFRINKNADISNINCRIDSLHVPIFVQTMNVIFNVSELPCFVIASIILVRRMVLTPKSVYSLTDNNPSSVTLEIACMPMSELSKMPCDMDVNLLVENSSSRYLRCDYDILRKYVDKIHHITDRIEQKKFCMLDCSECITFDTTRQFIEKASGMINQGWTMDDDIWGEKTWIINKWITFQMRAKDIRTTYTKHKLERMVAQEECMLCNETFQANDVVMNTRCNHNFHWGVARSTDGTIRCRGLVEWVKRDKDSCPCCRTKMF